MIHTHFPTTWTAQERNVYLAWQSGHWLTKEDDIILKGCFERIRKGDRPHCVLQIESDFEPDQQLSLDGYGPLDRHQL